MILSTSYLSKIIANNSTNPNIKPTIAIGNQRGANTHHHDQSIYPVNFSPINNKVNNPVNEIPELDVFLFDIIYII